VSTPPKFGEPGFVPRYSSADLNPIRVRIAERRAAAVGHSQREVLEGDTDIMETLVKEVSSLRIANQVLKEWKGVKDE